MATATLKSNGRTIKLKLLGNVGGNGSGSGCSVVVAAVKRLTILEADVKADGKSLTVGG